MRSMHARVFLPRSIACYSCIRVTIVVLEIARIVLLNKMSRPPIPMICIISRSTMFELSAFEWGLLYGDLEFTTLCYMSD